jgi:hypothetical protein
MVFANSPCQETPKNAAKTNREKIGVVLPPPNFRFLLLSPKNPKRLSEVILTPKRPQAKGKKVGGWVRHGAGGRRLISTASRRAWDFVCGIKVAIRSQQ